MTLLTWVLVFIGTLSLSTAITALLWWARWGWKDWRL